MWTFLFGSPAPELRDRNQNIEGAARCPMPPVAAARQPRNILAIKTFLAGELLHALDHLQGTVLFRSVSFLIIFIFMSASLLCSSQIILFIDSTAVQKFDSYRHVPLLSAGILK